MINREEVREVVSEVAGQEVRMEDSLIEGIPNMNSLGLLTVVTRLSEKGYDLDLSSLTEKELESVGGFADWATQ